jgi:hypothetical protein
MRRLSFVASFMFALMALSAPTSQSNTYRMSEVVEIGAAASIKLAKSGCTFFEVDYKIKPNYRDVGGILKFSVRKNPNYSGGGPARYAYEYFEYNFDLDTLEIYSNGADFFGRITLKVCSQEWTTEEGAKIRALTKPGNYFLIAAPEFFINPSKSFVGDYASRPIRFR